MSLSPGQVFKERYRIVGLLGQGGFGAVYRAWDLNLERPRALKENLDTSQKAQEQFKLEAQMLDKLVHPNLPRVIDHFILPGQGQYLVMDFVEGEDLQVKLDKAGGSLDEAQVLPWIEQICDALTYLHSQNPPVIHRDIKPANIKITPEGWAMLVDFGIAKLNDPNMAPTMRSKAVTPGYSPPEQYGGEVTEARSDIYALGATLYHLFTGEKPPESVKLASGMETLLMPSQFNSQIGSSVEQVILRCMELDKRNRLGSAVELKAALKTRGAADRVVTQPATSTFPFRTQSPLKQFLRWVWIGFLGVLAMMRLFSVLGDGIGGGSPADLIPTITVDLIPTITDDFGVSMALVPAGPFEMGSEELYDYAPVHTVALDHFYIDVYEVTNDLFAEFLNEEGNRSEGGATWLDADVSDVRIQESGGEWRADPGYEDHPVIEVTWYGARVFCEWRGARLPTEAEWEKAARGGLEGAEYPWGDEAPDCTLANYSGCVGDTEEVGSYSPNGYGLYDMAGNVWEWVMDWYDADYYSRSPTYDPRGPDSGRSRVLRSSSWTFSSWSLRSAYRYRNPPDFSIYSIGFRCARSP